MIVEVDFFQSVYEGSAAIILTPRCDFEQNKAEFVTICAVVSPSALRSKYPRFGTRGQLANIIDASTARFHWLNSMSMFQDGAIVDFQLLTAVELVVFESATIVAGLDSPWREQVSARYASYVGRVGVPDISKPDRRDMLDAAAGEAAPKSIGKPKGEA